MKSCLTICFKRSLLCGGHLEMREPDFCSVVREFTVDRGNRKAHFP